MWLSRGGRGGEFCEWKCMMRRFNDWWGRANGRLVDVVAAIVIYGDVVTC